MKRVSILTVILASVLVADADARRRKCRTWGRNNGSRSVANVQPLPSSANELSQAHQVLILVNQERGRRGIPPVKLTDDFNADGWSQSMRSRGRMHHASSFNGARSENVAVGSSSAEGVMRMWMNSSGHRSNILNRSWQWLDVGVSGRYWTQRFR